ncbi:MULTISPECIES: ArsR/SmtB family transcription factor [Streptomycetaceae]|uniref:ArsR family transcriptional regulator n=1 Tax=Streptantibioticus cattleyicolor (strain ATCC 35852 / DSM 46488 / JCM 4925 / NBRC 14057 / NRRL 8057) TaxID=1003195 RepID=F8JPT2_STREN|nr:MULTISPECIES: metalloregulator ArsR/SmtB family transcription factor [Streptomycetaceae]AEW92781.1 ArsR family transcriptional regulator [Streptantibioticus cattleyicolor NRRL 8057 = DSM 46488]MYS57544.1 metalloregulator ArsR/SmtB family transcription factor [Streptomyces sp. SID5468]CCB73136.1 Transcriptional regulator, ArsR family [Streptantibioticus cattleyicolor NRRL 8057 = DSM 46488]
MATYIDTSAAPRVEREADVARAAAVFGDASRVRVLLALGDGRELPASVLAAEAGVSPSTVSAHLARLLQAGLVVARTHGRHCYYRLSGPEVSDVLEALARVAPDKPVRSLRDGTRAQQLRRCRTCYDHLAGRLGVALMDALLGRGVLAGGDGRYRSDDTGLDRPSAPGRDAAYRVTEYGARFLADFGIDPAGLPRRRPAVRYCVDWSEQRHHLSGALGAALTDRFFALGWIRRAETRRVVRVTDAGRAGLAGTFGVPEDWDNAGR